MLVAGINVEADHVVSCLQLKRTCGRRLYPDASFVPVFALLCEVDHEAPLSAFRTVLSDRKETADSVHFRNRLVEVGSAEFFVDSPSASFSKSSNLKA